MQTLGRGHVQPRHCFTSQAHIIHRTRTICNTSSIIVATQPATSSPSLQGLVVDVTNHNEASCSGTVQSIAQELGIDESQVSWLSRCRPELLRRPASRLTKRLEGLAELLGCTVKLSASMVQKQPALLDIDSVTIRRKLAELAQALGNDRRRACAAARRVPELLVSHHGQGLQAHMGQLALLFRINSSDGSVQLAWKEPLLLVMTIDQASQRMQGVADCLGLSYSCQQAASICRSHPWLLTMSSSRLTSKIQTLRSALHLSQAAALQLVISYPEVMSLSESSLLDKAEALKEVIPRHRLQSMICRQPSLLMRSCSKILQTFRVTQETAGLSTHATIDIVTRRPGILGKSPESQNRCYRALSIWKFTREEKQQLIQAHPLLLELSPREVHFRCRWLRQLMGSNGYYHSALRRIPLNLLGIIILHLPATWSRLQYLADSSWESKVQLTDALQMKAAAFDARFPEYKKWLHYKTSELGCKVPWRRVTRSKAGQAQQQHQQHQHQQHQHQHQHQQHQHQHQHQQRPGMSILPVDGRHTGPASTTGSTESHAGPASWHDAGSTGAAGSYQPTVISEARTVYYGMVPVCKPRRVVYTSGSDPVSELAEPGPGPGSEQGISLGPGAGAQHQTDGGRENLGHGHAGDEYLGQNHTTALGEGLTCLQLPPSCDVMDGESWEPGNVS